MASAWLGSRGGSLETCSGMQHHMLPAPRHSHVPIPHHLLCPQQGCYDKELTNGQEGDVLPMGLFPLDCSCIFRGPEKISRISPCKMILCAGPRKKYILWKTTIGKQQPGKILLLSKIFFFQCYLLHCVRLELNTLIFFYLRRLPRTLSK